MAITLPLRSQTGLTLSLEPTEASGSGAWGIIESFEQEPPGVEGSVTGQFPDTLVSAGSFTGTLTRSTTNAVEGTYSWYNNFSVTSTFAGFVITLSGDPSGSVDFSAYTKIRVTFTVDALTNVSSTTDLLYFRANDSSFNAVQDSAISFGVGTHVLELDFADNPSMDPADVQLLLQLTLESATDTLKEIDIYIDAIEGFDPTAGGGDPVNGFKVWNGSSWVVKPVKWYNGSTWVAKPLKRWNGSSWVAVEY